MKRPFAPLKKTSIEALKWAAGLRYRSEMAKLRSLSSDEFWHVQASSFAAAYADAVEHVPYYRSLPDDYPINLQSADDVLATARQLPILPKSAVKADVEKFWRIPR